MNISGNEIPVVMAANDNYAPYLGVSIESLINQVSDDSTYIIYILHRSISDYHKNKILSLERTNVKIKFVEVCAYLERWNIPTIGHLSEETAYRLIVDKIFSCYRKIVYLDSDTIIRRDIRELYDIDIEGYVLGASRGRLVKSLYEYIVNELGLLPETYINAGVLLINVEEFRREGIGEKALTMLSEGEYLCQDQDVLNILCRDKIKYIDGHWNFEWQHLTGLGGEVVIDELREGTLDYIKDPYIIHYTSRIKPWMRPDIELADCFWNIARSSLFYEEILHLNVKSRQPSEEYCFPKQLVDPDSRCVIYGFGRVGKSFYNEILRTKYCELVAICDKKASEIEEMPVPVIFPKDISNVVFDYIVIAVERKKMANDIYEKLIEYGVQENKIKWESPVIVRKNV